jgi:hypothetical protein
LEGGPGRPDEVESPGAAAAGFGVAAVAADGLAASGFDVVAPSVDFVVSVGAGGT